MRPVRLITTAALSLALLATPAAAEAAPPTVTAKAPPAAARYQDDLHTSLSAAEVLSKKTTQPQTAPTAEELGKRTCNPQNKKKYCSPESAGHWGKYLATARKRVIKAKNRSPKKYKSAYFKGVPFPNINTAYSRLDGWGAVYVITGRPVKNGKPVVGPLAVEGSVYKFGMTRARSLGTRALRSLAQCKADPRFVQCGVRIVAFTRYQNGGYHARWLEAALITRYKRATGKCPIGAPSCR